MVSLTPHPCRIHVGSMGIQCTNHCEMQGLGPLLVPNALCAQSNQNVFYLLCGLSGSIFPGGCEWGNDLFKANSYLSTPRISTEHGGCKKEPPQPGALASSLPSTLWSLPFALPIPTMQCVRYPGGTRHFSDLQPLLSFSPSFLPKSDFQRNHVSCSPEFWLFFEVRNQSLSSISDVGPVLHGSLISRWSC